VIHVASVVFMKQPKNEDLAIKPAVIGTENVLKACIKYKIKKIVITSSIKNTHY